MRRFMAAAGWPGLDEATGPLKQARVSTETGGARGAPPADRSGIGGGRDDAGLLLVFRRPIEPPPVDLSAIMARRR